MCVCECVYICCEGPFLQRPGHNIPHCLFVCTQTNSKKSTSTPSKSSSCKHTTWMYSIWHLLQVGTALSIYCSPQKNREVEIQQQPSKPGQEIWGVARYTLFIFPPLLCLDATKSVQGHMGWIALVTTYLATQNPRVHSLSSHWPDVIPPEISSSHKSPIRCSFF